MATPAPKKTVKLRIKVPANVTVITEFVKVPAELPINLADLKASLSTTPTVMDMDLTSVKTSDWLRKKTIASSDCSNCCCVRG